MQWKLICGVRDVVKLHTVVRTGAQHVRSSPRWFLTLRVIVLETDLELDGLDELTRLLLAPLQDGGKRLLEGINVQLGHWVGAR